MKNLLITSVIAASLFSCKKAEPVIAYLNVDKNEILVNEIVQFENLSENYVTAEWDFGDGTQSEVANTSHRYTESGEYTVRLRVLDAEGNSAEHITRVNVYEAKLAKITIDHPELTNENYIWNINYNFNSLMNNPKIIADTITENKIEYVYKNTQPVNNQDVTLNASAYEVDWWNWNLVLETDLVFNAYDEVTLENLIITKADTENEFTATFSYELEL